METYSILNVYLVLFIIILLSRRYYEYKGFFDSISVLVALMGKWWIKTLLDRGEDIQVKRYVLQFGERMEFSFQAAYLRSLEHGDDDPVHYGVQIFDFAGLSLGQLWSPKCKRCI